MTKSVFYARLAACSLAALILFCVLEELWLAPLRPNGSWLVLKVIPLLFVVSGVFKQKNYTMQWASMLILLYFTEGIVRATSDKLATSALLGWVEAGISLIFFYAVLSYLGPIKKENKAKNKSASATDANHPP